MAGVAKPKKTDFVVVNVNPSQNAGDNQAVGVVLAVHDDEEGQEHTLVDVKVLLNGDENLTLRRVPLLSKADAKKFPGSKFATRS